MLMLISLLGCVNSPMKGETETPDMAPINPVRDVSVVQKGNLICVTENGDPVTQRCVPRVHEEDEQ